MLRYLIGRRQEDRKGGHSVVSKYIKLVLGILANRHSRK